MNLRRLCSYQGAHFEAGLGLASDVPVQEAASGQLNLVQDFELRWAARADSEIDEPGPPIAWQNQGDVAGQNDVMVLAALGINQGGLQLRIRDDRKRFLRANLMYVADHQEKRLPLQCLLFQGRGEVYALMSGGLGPVSLQPAAQVACAEQVSRSPLTVVFEQGRPRRPPHEALRGRWHDDVVYEAETITEGTHEPLVQPAHADPDGLVARACCRADGAWFLL